MRQFLSLFESDDHSSPVLKDIASRIDHADMEEWAGEQALDWDEIVQDGIESEAEYYLSDRYSIRIRDDGLVTFWGLEDETERLIGENRVALYHYTSSTNEKSIRTHGLGSHYKSVNGTIAQGVYLSANPGGQETRSYVIKALQAVRGKARDTAHGICITVWMRLSELYPDLDDAHIQSGNHQFMCDEVPPERIVEIERA